MDQQAAAQATRAVVRFGLTELWSLLRQGCPEGAGTGNLRSMSMLIIFICSLRLSFAGCAACWTHLTTTFRPYGNVREPLNPHQRWLSKQGEADLLNVVERPWVL